MRFLAVVCVFATILLSYEICFAGIYEAMAEALNTAVTSNPCEEFDKNTANAELHPAYNSCIASDLHSAGRPMAGIPELSYEEMYFGMLAQTESKSLICSSDFAQSFVEGPLAENLQTQFFNKINSLVLLKSALNKRSMELGGIPCPNSIEELKQNPNHPLRENYFSLCRDINQLRTAYQMNRAAITFGELEPLDNLINELEGQGLKDTRNLSVDKIKTRLVRAYSSASAILAKDARILAAGARDPKKIDVGQRRALMSDPRLFQEVVSANPRLSILEKVRCSADARYGSGANRLDSAMTGTSLALMVLTGGISVGARMTSTAFRAFNASRSLGVISLRSTRLLQLSAASLATDGFIAYRQIDSACFSNQAKFSSMAGQCSNKNLLAEAQQENCILATALNSLAVIGNASVVSHEAAKFLHALKAQKSAKLDVKAKEAERIAEWAKYNEEALKPENLVEQPRFAQFHKQPGDRPTNTHRLKTVDDQRYADVYEDAIRRGDPQIETLKSLGAKVKDGKLILPKASTIMTNLNRKLNDLVASGKVTEDQVLRPVRVFVMRSGKKVYALQGEKVPKDVRPFSGLLKFDEFAELLQQGKFPIGEVQASNIGRDSNTVLSETAFLHDLNHFGAFLDDPPLMGAYRQAYKNLRYSPGAEESDLLRFRANQLLEGFVTAKVTERNGIVSQIKSLDLVPNSQSTNFGSYRAFKANDYAVVLKDKSPSEIGSLANSLNQRATQSLHYWGGSSRDLPFRVGRPIYTLESSEGDLEALHRSLDVVAKGQGSAEWRIEVLSRYLAAIDHSSQVPAATIVQDGFRMGSLDRKSPTYSFICLSGVFTPASNTFKNFCK